MRELFDPDGPGSSPHTRGARSSPTSHRSDGRIIPAYAGSTGLQLIDTALYMDHPRIRGEHASTANLAAVRRGSSPHTRGARKWEIRLRFGMRIIPAYAGSTRCRSRRRGRSRDHPRIRGEHAVDVRADRRRRGSSPHTRGARELGRHLLFDAGIIPAYAGSTFARDVEVADETGSSPHTRGALRRSLRLGRRGRIIPAYAGSTCARFLRRRGVPDHPRIRGEHNICASVCDSPVGSSPHTRGAPPSTFPKASAWRIIPAYAGSTGHTQPHGQLFADHPRIRGEHPLLLRCEFEWLGSSPHTRGALIMKDSISKSVRIIPAYAGSTSMSTMTGVRITDHPRIRGEHDDKRRAGQPRSGIIPAYAGSTGQHTPSHRPASGSSPHTRGAPVKPLRGGVAHRIIPAYAGSTRAPPSASTRLRDHPRIRGEHLAKSLTEKLGGGSSPHTRGALDCRPEGRVLMGIIPAYAGSTPPAPKSRNTGRDHPRIRGEHVDGWEGAGWARGSSPHTRGARRALSRAGPGRRIIPAYAGSTRPGCRR